MKKIKLNLGCASRPLKDYINIDQDDFNVIKKRYPNLKVTNKLKIYNYDIFNLPYRNSSVDEIRADGLIEHLSFLEEKKFFFEIKRVLKKNGILRLSTVDFEKTIKLWLKAKDDWKDFHRNDSKAIKEQFWFGTYTYKPKNRWGYLTATFYGSQNGKEKLRAICKKLDFKVMKLEDFRWKKDRDYMINIIAKKIN